MQLTDLHIPNATRMNLTVAGPDKNLQACGAQLLGYRCDHSVLAFLPKRPAFPLRQDSKVDVRLGLQSAIYRFSSTLMVVSEHPYLYLHLAYPAEVTIEKQLREALRFPFDTAATCIVDGSNSIVQCVFVDISLSGALLAFKEKLPASASRIRIYLLVQIANSEQRMELDATVKSHPEESADATFCYGIAFIEKNVQQQLLLEAMCFELQVRKF